MQVKPELGTEPFDVAGLKVQFTVSTSSPDSVIGSVVTSILARIF